MNSKCTDYERQTIWKDVHVQQALRKAEGSFLYRLGPV